MYRSIQIQILSINNHEFKNYLLASINELKSISIKNIIFTIGSNTINTFSDKIILFDSIKHIDIVNTK